MVFAFGLLWLGARKIEADRNAARAEQARVELQNQAFDQEFGEHRTKAVHGDAKAQCLLGSCYVQGEVVARNYPEAVKWFRLAAEQNYPPAQLFLGNCYHQGHGVPKNFVEAYAWLSLAAPMEPGAAAFLKDLERRMTPQKIADGQKRAEELRTRIPAKPAPAGR